VQLPPCTIAPKLIALIQRVTKAAVVVRDGAAERVVGKIGPGILALIGIERNDDIPHAERLLTRVLTYRIFADDAGRMNLSLAETGGGLLLVPQFTLVADTHKGTRPGFSSAAAPEAARALFGQLVAMARARHPHVAAGEFGAHMEVSLVNDGPVTFWLKTAPNDKDLKESPSA
jgi:D-aminoacyl-tRNA deacylase